MDQSTVYTGAMPEVSAEAGKASRTGAPWYCRVVVLAAAFIWLGVVWDISWHSAIGRDTFWTLAHICIHIGGGHIALSDTHDAEVRSS